jgi:hypothetical protein
VYDVQGAAYARAHDPEPGAHLRHVIGPNTGTSPRGSGLEASSVISHRAEAILRATIGTTQSDRASLEAFGVGGDERRSCSHFTPVFSKIEGQPQHPSAYCPSIQNAQWEHRNPTAECGRNCDQLRNPVRRSRRTLTSSDILLSAHVGTQSACGMSHFRVCCVWSVHWAWTHAAHTCTARVRRIPAFPFPFLRFRFLLLAFSKRGKGGFGQHFALAKRPTARCGTGAQAASYTPPPHPSPPPRAPSRLASRWVLKHEAHASKHARHIRPSSASPPCAIETSSICGQGAGRGGGAGGGEGHGESAEKRGRFRQQPPSAATGSLFRQQPPTPGTDTGNR